MPTTPQLESKPSSRRALLAGALGGLGALAATFIGRASPVRGADGDTVTVGGTFSGTHTTKISTTDPDADAVWGHSDSTTGLHGSSSSGIGVFGRNTSGIAVYGASTSNVGVYGSSSTRTGVTGLSGSEMGVYGVSSATDQSASVGNSVGDSTGVQGYSGSNALTIPAAKAKTGVYGHANQDSSAVGVLGESPIGSGVIGSSTSGFGMQGISSSGPGVYGESVLDTGVHGSSDSGSGVYGQSTSALGVYGNSTSYIGVYGVSTFHVGAWADSHATDLPAIVGRAYTNSTGVMGISGVVVPAARPKTGVYGYAAQDSHSMAIFGESPAGWAGYFEGKVYMSRFQEMTESSPTPSAPTANKARLFLKDNGSGLTQLCVRFHTGAIKVLATEG